MFPEVRILYNWLRHYRYIRYYWCSCIDIIHTHTCISIQQIVLISVLGTPYNQNGCISCIPCRCKRFTWCYSSLSICAYLVVVHLAFNLLQKLPMCHDLVYGIQFLQAKWTNNRNVLNTAILGVHGARRPYLVKMVWKKDTDRYIQIYFLW